MADKSDKAFEALANLSQNVTSYSGPQNRLAVEKTARFLQLSGVTLDEVDQLGVIHVSGTKGKGSTCAFAESILRNRGLKTGLFTLPHLVSFAERIRINGDSIDKSMFANYFWSIYDCVVVANPGSEMPTPFQFLTVMAYHIFVREKVDVAIFEGKGFDASTCDSFMLLCSWSGRPLPFNQFGQKTCSLWHHYPRS